MDFATIKQKLGFKLKAKPDEKGPPGTRVYHEFFVGAEATPMGFEWLGRVYGDGVHQQSGFAKSRAGARSAALAWCERTKAAIVLTAPRQNQEV